MTPCAEAFLPRPALSTQAVFTTTKIALMCVWLRQRETSLMPTGRSHPHSHLRCLRTGGT